MDEILIDFKREHGIAKDLDKCYTALADIYISTGPTSPLETCHHLHMRLFHLFDAWASYHLGYLKATVPSRSLMGNKPVLSTMLSIMFKTKGEETYQTEKDKKFFNQLYDWVVEFKQLLPLIFPQESLLILRQNLGDALIDPLSFSKTQLFSIRTKNGRASNLVHFNSLEGSIFEGKTSSVVKDTECDSFWRVKSKFVKHEAKNNWDHFQWIPDRCISLFSAYAAIEVLLSSKEQGNDPNLAFQMATFTRGILSNKLFETLNGSATAMDPTYLLLLAATQARINQPNASVLVQDPFGSSAFVSSCAVRFDFIIFVGQNLNFIKLQPKTERILWPQNRNREVFFFPTLGSILDLNAFFSFQIYNLFNCIFIGVDTVSCFMRSDYLIKQAAY